VLTLLAIVGGVPAALVRFVGWPLPASAPTVDAVSAALLYGQIAPDTLLKPLAVIVWVTWSLMTAGLLVEVVALVRGTVARPTVGRLQQMAGRLLTAAMLLSTLTTRPAVAAAPAVAPVAVVVAARDAATTPVDDGPRDGATWVVRRRDSLWTIADSALGDGRRWREIRDLNVGREQRDGRRLQADDTTIHPGWILRLPDAADTEDRPRQITVEPGDHLWGLAEEHLGDGARWRRLYDDNEGERQADGGRLTRPDLIRPGWVLRLTQDRTAASSGASEDRDSHHTPHNATDPQPGAPDDHDGHHTPHNAPVAPLPVTPLTLPDARDRAAEATSPAVGSLSPLLSEPVVMAASASRAERDMRPVAGVALLAAGLVGMVARRRRQWLRHRQPGSALPPVDPEVAELERWLRAMADHDVSHRTDRVLRLLTEHFTAHDLRPAVFALELGEQVSLLLSDAAISPPPGITVTEDGRRWVLDPEFEVAAPSDDDQPPFVPALVACGRRSSGEIVALNLLHLGVLEISGPTYQVHEALTSWTAELASRGAADDVELIVVGPHHHQVEQFARVTIADDAAAAITRVDRALTSGDPPGPAPSHVVVLSTAPSEGQAWNALRGRAAHDSRLALVLPGDGDAGHHLRLDGDHVRLDPPGLELLAPEWLTPHTWDRVGDLLNQPIRQRQSELIPSPLLTTPLDRALIGLADLDADEQAPPRMVRVLGPLRIDAVPKPGAQTGDLIAYLAAHREGATISTLQAHVGSPQTNDDAVRAMIDAARDALGCDDAGRPLLTVDADGRHRLADGMGSDLGRFRLLTSRMTHGAPADQARRMHEALALVEGPPFCDSGAWAHTTGLVTATTALICDVAHRLAVLVMTFGELDRAAWAVDQGLRANLECELLHRDRMRIADARGDHIALESVMHDLRTRVEADGGWMSPETLQLYERLRRSSAITAAPSDEIDDRRDAS
jgi:hypothetical protein